MALHRAAREGDVAQVSQLLAAGGDVNARFVIKTPYWFCYRCKINAGNTIVSVDSLPDHCAQQTLAKSMLQRE
jgi:ankyrin repeat protein